MTGYPKEWLDHVRVTLHFQTTRTKREMKENYEINKGEGCEGRGGKREGGGESGVKE